MAVTINSHSLCWKNFLDEGREYVQDCNTMPPSGHLTRVTGLVMEAVGLQMPVENAATLPAREPARQGSIFQNLSSCSSTART